VQEHRHSSGHRGQGETGADLPKMLGTTRQKQRGVGRSGMMTLVLPRAVSFANVLHSLTFSTAYPSLSLIVQKEKHRGRSTLRPFFVDECLLFAGEEDKAQFLRRLN